MVIRTFSGSLQSRSLGRLGKWCNHKKIKIVKIFLVDIESVPTRYTCEWKTHVTKLLEDAGFEVFVV